MELIGLIMLVVVVLLVGKVIAPAKGERRAKPGRGRTDLSVGRLSSTLQSGELPAPVTVAFHLEPDEKCVGMFQADVEQWLEGDGSYTEKHVGWASGLTALAVGGTVNAVGNGVRKATAARRAQERWRLVGSYSVYVTTERVVFDGGNSRSWDEFWLQDLRRLERDGTALVLQAAGHPANRVHAAPPEYWYLLLRHLAFGHTPGGDART